MIDENVKLIDSNEMGEELYDVYCPLFGYSISMVVEPDGTELLPSDFQGAQAQSLSEVPDYDWYADTDIDY